ncbi:hypothetical protein IMG5_133470 [Ichthyophthirius multifiliis]|uniref:Transmembrane protein n=1 Tax=Ichthyophthirius multifiliis TaxID=5932 RepID=G0QWM1_ICHMU|nr:hypothetical protein IMG5_133470 [Ichthyophthirius multifiliis]EGR30380.1 hypothetical protein IMG5_133470 [Ichthyophthirius multifiliis]|eukprot:XP_004031967.1 hypothetical protein IMG5_133470 [Ichthyophthirius multifiliis]
MNFQEYQQFIFEFLYFFHFKYQNKFLFYHYLILKRNVLYYQYQNELCILNQLNFNFYQYIIQRFYFINRAYYYLLIYLGYHIKVLANQFFPKQIHLQKTYIRFVKNYHLLKCIYSLVLYCFCEKFELGFLTLMIILYGLLQFQNQILFLILILLIILNYLHSMRIRIIQIYIKIQMEMIINYF